MILNVAYLYQRFKGTIETQISVFRGVKSLINLD